MQYKHTGNMESMNSWSFTFLSWLFTDDLHESGVNDYHNHYSIFYSQFFKLALINLNFCQEYTSCQKNYNSLNPGPDHLSMAQLLINIFNMISLKALFLSCGVKGSAKSPGGRITWQLLWWIWSHTTMSSNPSFTT